METELHLCFPPHTRVDRTPNPEPEGHTGELCGGKLLRQAAHMPQLTLLGCNAGILLTFCPPVRHGLEAAGTYGMAALQGAHVILGCRTDRVFRPVCQDTGRSSKLENVWRGGYKVHEERQTYTNTQG